MARKKELKHICIGEHLPALVSTMQAHRDTLAEYIGTDAASQARNALAWFVLESLCGQFFPPEGEEPKEPDFTSVKGGNVIQGGYTAMIDWAIYKSNEKERVSKEKRKGTDITNATKRGKKLGLAGDELNAYIQSETGYTPNVPKSTPSDDKSTLSVPDATVSVQNGTYNNNYNYNYNDNEKDNNKSFSLSLDNEKGISTESNSNSVGCADSARAPYGGADPHPVEYFIELVRKNPKIKLAAERVPEWYERMQQSNWMIKGVPVTDYQKAMNGYAKHCPAEVNLFEPGSPEEIEAITDSRSEIKRMIAANNKKGLSIPLEDDDSIFPISSSIHKCPQGYVSANMTGLYYWAEHPRLLQTFNHFEACEALYGQFNHIFHENRARTPRERLADNGK